MNDPEAENSESKRCESRTGDSVHEEITTHHSARSVPYNTRYQRFPANATRATSTKNYHSIIQSSSKFGGALSFQFYRASLVKLDITILHQNKLRHLRIALIYFTSNTCH